MAVTLTEPNDVQPVGNCLEFGLTLSDGGGENEIKSIGYQLQTAAGSALTVEEQIPYTGETERRSFEEVLRNHVFTTVPDVATIYNGTTDSNFTLEFNLKYGEISHDTETCVTTKAINQTSANHYAVNSALQFFEAFNSLESGAFILSHKPYTFNTGKRQSDWFWIWARSGTTVCEVRQYDSSGSQIAFNNANASHNNSAHYWSVGGGNGFFGLQSNTSYYTIRFTNEGSQIGKTYTVYVGNSGSSSAGCGTSDDSSSPVGELYWLEPLGGYASLLFNSAEYGNLTSSSMFETPLLCGASVGIASKNYGRTRYGTKSFRRVAFRTTLDYSLGLERYLDGLFASESCLVRYQLPDNTFQAVKFVLANEGGYSFDPATGEVTVEVIGEIHFNVNTQ